MIDSIIKNEIEKIFSILWRIQIKNEIEIYY